MSKAFLFNRMEFAGSLGDLGTILPIAFGIILINGLTPVGLFASVGLYYLLSGVYFRVTCPVEPMKVIGAYAVATGISSQQIHAAGLLVGIFLLIIALTGIINGLRRLIPVPVIRGVQLSTGLLLISQGVKLILGNATIQQLHGLGEPFLSIHHLGPVSIGVPIGILLGVITLALLNNQRLPAALVVVGIGICIGIVAGKQPVLSELKPGFYLPTLLSGGWPKLVDFSLALFVLALPQMPMTLGNAVIANSDLALQYFPQDGHRVTPRALCLSMAFANIGSFFIGGMPMCHGAGGLASRYRFGARTAGSNLIIGFIFLALALFLGPHSLTLIQLIPLAALGVLLIFAGAQLSLTLLDMKTPKMLFVPIMIVGITLASNLAVGFVVGICLSYILKSQRFNI